MNDRLNDWFRKFAHKISTVMGSPFVFALAIAVIFCWALLGPSFHYSDTWQLVINTGTTVITFLMVFLIQNTQNRDARAIHLKLDELIRATRHARNQLIDLEELSEKELDSLHQELCEWQKKSENHLEKVIQQKRKHLEKRGLL